MTRSGFAFRLSQIPHSNLLFIFLMSFAMNEENMSWSKLAFAPMHLFSFVCTATQGVIKG